MNFAKASNVLVFGAIVASIGSRVGGGPGLPEAFLTLGAFVLGVVLAWLSVLGFGRVPGQPYRAPWIPLSIGTALLLVVGLTVATELGRPRPTRQPESREPVVRDDYHFRLRWSGEGWSTLPATAAGSLHPLAAAGARRADDVLGLVLAERTDKTVQVAGREEALGRRLIDAMPLRDKKVLRCGGIDFLGGRAVRYQVTGYRGDVHLRYENTVFESRGVIYQLIVWGPAGATAEDGSSFAPFVEAFELLPEPAG